MIRKKISKGLLVLMTFLSSVSMAQVTNSPYTFNGLGDVADLGLINTLGMGGLGVSYGSPWFINNVNPALLVRNGLFTTFDIGAASDLRHIRDASGSNTNFQAGLYNAILSVPVSRDRWVASIGLKPLTNVRYNINSTQTVVSDGEEFEVQNQFQGTGGLSQFFISNGVKLNKNFSVGLMSSYTFGAITKTLLQNPLSSSSAIDDSFLFINEDSILSVSGFTFQLGGAYQGKIGNDTYLNLGGAYMFESNLNATELVTISNAGTPADTVQNLSGKVTFPATTWAGISFEKRYKWMVGFDYRRQQWDKFRDFQGNNEGLRPSDLYILGGKYTPNINDVNNYWNRVTYRAAVRFENTQYMQNNNQVQDLGINFGLSLPVYTASYINFAVQVGQRGSLDKGQVRENYAKIFLGFTFNDKWFIRRKLD
ncbi:hypothetical protein [Xanthovirga aplysinae]|uniref:hypothetical protein n=1 Tax=Xanthovirga aplysinae TaxID=2529853 RepID=UPI0012BCA16F|nr:hypothetical protein [Xanthovirga aplysinae]MTI33435.1 hypothetical protein [Xanthovirga aplysinae]